MSVRIAWRGMLKGWPSMFAPAMTWSISRRGVAICLDIGIAGISSMGYSVHHS